MLTTARWRVNRGKEKNLCCSCERLLVGGNIGAKLEGWRHFDGDKERIDGDQRSGGGRSAFETGNGTAAGGRSSMAASGGFASHPRTSLEWRRSFRRGENCGCRVGTSRSAR